MKEVVIVSAVRTPIGSFGGGLKNISAVELGKIVIKNAMDRISLDPKLVNEVFMGCVLQAGYGQGVARQASIHAGIPVETPATTINMICGSGLKSISLAYQTIISGYNDIVIAGGTENMSMAPYILKKARFGYRMGNGELYDTMVKDGLWEVFNDYHMGITAENIAEQWNISRDDQDQFALTSQQRAAKARDSGRFKDEIVPVEIPQRKKEPILFDTDEFIRDGTTIEKLSKLRPAFKKDGTVTAGNASGINDGAAAVVVMSKEKADELGLKPLFRIVGHATAGVDPSIMGTGPIPASRKVLKNTGLTLDEIDLVEANEAFASQSLCVIKELGLNPEITNVNGGAIALGHPIGASGARILVTLMYEMMKRQSTYGLATLCVGGGMGEAMIVERL